MNRILMIGAGNVGGVAAHKMAQMPEVFGETYIAARNTKPLLKVHDSIKAKGYNHKSVYIETVDASNIESVIKLIKQVEPTIVANIGPPYWNLNIMEACLKANVHYLDTACYEHPEKLGFSNKLQLEMNDAFKKKGLMAQLQVGFDPGVTNIMISYCLQERIFDEIKSADILDCNAGKKDAVWAPNFDPEINIRELILPIHAIHNGRWTSHGSLIDCDAIHFNFRYPQAGPADTYLMYHEELESLHRSFPEIKRMRFWMTFSEEYLNHLRVLHNVKMTSIEPIEFEGNQVVPVRFLKELLPKGKDFNESYVGKTCIGCIIRGIRKNREKIVFIYQVCDHKQSFLETNGNAIGYTTAIPAVTALEMILSGVWFEPGVHVPESRPAKLFLVALAKNGLPWTMRSLRELPEFLKQDFKGKKAA